MAIVAAALAGSAGAAGAPGATGAAGAAGAAGATGAAGAGSAGSMGNGKMASMFASGMGGPNGHADNGKQNDPFEKYELVMEKASSVPIKYTPSGGRAQNSREAINSLTTELRKRFSE